MCAWCFPCLFSWHSVGMYGGFIPHLWDGKSLWNASKTKIEGLLGAGLTFGITLVVQYLSEICWETYWQYKEQICVVMHIEDNWKMIFVVENVWLLLRIEKLVVALVVKETISLYMFCLWRSTKRYQVWERHFGTSVYGGLLSITSSELCKLVTTPIKTKCGAA